MPSTCLRMPSRCLSDASQTPPICLPDAPPRCLLAEVLRCLQSGPLMPPRCFQIPPDDSRCLQDAFSMLPRCLQIPSDACQMYARCLQLPLSCLLGPVFVLTFRNSPPDASSRCFKCLADVSQIFVMHPPTMSPPDGPSRCFLYNASCMMPPA